MDEIRIQDLEVYCHHGVLKEENVLGQKFLVSLSLFTDTRKAGNSDNLSFSIDYAEVSHFVEKKLKETTYQLIESVAEHIAKDILQEFSLVEKIKVEIKKPWAPILLPLDTVSVTIERGWTKVYLSVGSNMGDKEKYITDAVKQLEADKSIKEVKLSSIIETEPYGNVEQDKFLNAAIELKTLYAPEELLNRLHEIEANAGRERVIHWGPRTLDLDIIFYGKERIQTEELTIPHKEMHLRQFVLEPLAELAPWETHPVFGKTVWELHEKVRKQA